MKNFILFNILLISSLTSSAQLSKDLVKFEISGVVIEKSSNVPLEFATIIVKPIKGDKIYGGLTDENGAFKFDVPKGVYNISVEFLSFKTVHFNNTTVDKDKNLGTIYVEEDAEALDEIELIAEKSTVEIKLDKKIYNVGKDMTVRGGTASDVLDNIPSITVDAEGAVSLRGNDDVKILINGKPSGLIGLNGAEALKQFPAEAILSVEVITSPSARYDAEGTGGILNIILRQDKMLGFNGSATLNGGYPAYYGASTNLNYRIKKVNFFTNLGYSNRDSPGNIYSKTNNFPTSSSDGSIVTEYTDRERNRKSFNGNIGAEYFFNEKTSLTGSFLYRTNNGDDLSTNNSSVERPSDYEELLRKEYETGKDKVQQYSLNFMKNFAKSGHKLTFDFQYEDSSEDEISTITNEKVFPNPEKEDGQQVFSDEGQKETLLQGDYVLPIGENQQLEAGFRSTLKDNQTDYDFYNEENGNYVLNNNLSNIFNYEENIYAAYTQYGNKFGNISALFGLRMEYSDIGVSVQGKSDEPDNIDIESQKNYTNFFPTVNLAYEFSESENISLGYNRRIRRPRSRFINPFPSLSSRTTVFQGNPDLDPSISNGIDIGYYKNWRKVTFNTSIYYSHATDVFQFISEDSGQETEDGLPIIRRTPINLSTNDRYGVEFSVNYTPIRKWRLNGSFNFYNSTIEGVYNDVDYGNQNLSWFARFSSKFTLPAEIDSQINMMFRGPNEDSQNKSQGIFTTNLAFSKDVLKGNGTISFNVNDLFNSSKRRTETLTDTYFAENDFQWRERSFRVGFSYRFKQKKKRERPQQGGSGDDDGGFEG